jgi:hypothetical protein
VAQLIRLAAAVALAAAACGSGSTEGVASLDDSATTSTTTVETAAASTEEALLAFAECLREQGLEVDDPDFDGTGGFGIAIGGGGGGGPGAGRLDADTQAAMEICQPLLEGVRGQFQDFDPSDLEDQLYAFAECMREEGVDWPDPDLTAFAPGGGARGPQTGEPGDGPTGGGPFGGGDIDMDDPLVQAALEACQSDLGFGFRAGGPGGTPPGGQG